VSTTNDTIPDGYKRCKSGTECEHPDGPVLPETTEFFPARDSKSGFYARCIPCYRKQTRENMRKRRQNPVVKAYYHQKDLERRSDPVKHARELQYLRDRHKNPEFRRKKREYEQRPDVKAKQNERNRKRRQDPAFNEQQRLYMREYHKTPKRQQYIRNRHQSEEHKVYQERYAQSERGHASRKTRYNRRRAKFLALPDTFTVDDWIFALAYFHGCCAACGRQLNDLFGERTAAADHWIPLNAPDCPGTVPENIVPLCHGKDGCNNSKHAKHPIEWLIERFGKHKANQINQRIQEFFANVRKD
jgi:hypothetical protein